MSESGVVVYRVESRDRLGATWFYSGLEGGRVGSGVATGDTMGGFAGAYRVVYRLPDGSEQGPFDLDIASDGEVFRLSWRREGQVAFTGVGFETAIGLVASYAPTGGSAPEDAGPEG